MSSEVPVAADSLTSPSLTSPSLTSPSLRSTSRSAKSAPIESRSESLSSQPLPNRSVDAKSAVAAPLSLADLAVSQSAVVVKVSCARPTAIRLMEMGLLPGTRVTLLRRAPLGDPLELSINGYALSIRRAEALLVNVQRVSEEHAAKDASPTSALADDDGVEVT